MGSKTPTFHFAMRLVVISLLCLVLPLCIFGYLTYHNDVASEKRIAHLAVQIELERNIDRIEEALVRKEEVLSKIIANVDHTSESELMHLKPSGSELYAFEKQGLSWRQTASSDSKPLGPLSHNFLDRIAAGNGLVNMLGDQLAISEAKDSLVLIMTEPAQTFLKQNTKIEGEYPLELSLRPLLQIDKDQIIYKKSVPNSSLYLTAALPKSVYSKAVHSSFTYKIGWAALIVLCIGSVGMLLFYKRSARPFTRFVNAMHELGRGNFGVRIPDDGKGLELHDLSRTFNTTLDELEATIAAEKKARNEKERLSDELEWAKRIQKSLLPKALPTLSGIEIATHFSPALEVSGDFYDLFEADGRLVFMIADAAGKGLGPALFALGLRGALRALFATKGDLKTRLYEANRLFCEDSKESGMFATAFVGELDLTRFELTYINAGHLPALVKKRDGTSLKLEKTAPSFGLPWENIHMQRVGFESGSILSIFTDGLTEQTSSTKEEFGIERIEQALKNSASAEKNTEKVLSLYKEFSASEARVDDISLITLRRP